MRLADLDSVDFRLLPTEALRALQGKLHEEFRRRSEDNLILKRVPGFASPKRTWRVQMDGPEIEGERR